LFTHYCTAGWASTALQAFLIVCHPVAHADLSENIDRLGGVFLQLAPDVCHVYPQNFIVGFRIRSPDIVHHGRVCHDFAGILGKEYHNFVFNRR